MIPYIGDFAEDATVYHYFNTFDSNDPSASVTVTDLVDADIFVYKDGSVTDLGTDGATVVVNFDSRTGLHKITIDTSVHADYATGSDYLVSVVGITVDGATLNVGLFTFSIQNRYSAGALRPTTAGRTLDVTATGAAGIDWGNVENPTTVVDLSGTDIQLCDTVTTLTGHTAQTGDNYARLGAPAGASVSADIAAIEAQTDDIGVAGAGLTAIPWNSAWDAEVQSEVDDALVAQRLDHLVAVADADDVVNNSIIAKMVSSAATADWSGFVNTTDSLQAVRDHIGDGTNLTEAGGTGDHLTAINLPNQTMDIIGNITGNLSGSVGSVTGAVGSVTGAVGSVAGNVDGNVTGSVGSNLELGPAEVNAEVVDVLTVDTIAEPTGVPAATATLATKIGYLYMALRNKVTVTATKKTFFDDGDAAEWEKDLSDDATTYTESEGNAI